MIDWTITSCPDEKTVAILSRSSLEVVTMKPLLAKVVHHLWEYNGFMNAGKLIVLSTSSRSSGPEGKCVSGTGMPRRTASSCWRRLLIMASRTFSGGVRKRKCSERALSFWERKWTAASDAGNMTPFWS
ncbi:MAG: hypothetical protein A4E29_00635 [Methanomassiliicoccales archaeon PtaB.Bin134]|nr:MAG: hypothetical protein A4E29_00635 [Methanomassiliicoccales archaeon PtaB.Bin134]OPY27039.1 MAG: hypothetical protein A4E31_01302 [Methanomassiliicoccales archaeon PtaU1.Bin030]